MATLERDAAGALVARSLPTDEIDEHLQAIESAATALRKWRDEIQSGHAADDAPEPPLPPPQEPQPSKAKARFVIKTK
jgi:transposase-like protein